VTSRDEAPRVMACSRCWCRDLRVIWTYRAVDGSIRRRRRCRHCGLEATTVERTLADIGDPRKKSGFPPPAG